MPGDIDADAVNEFVASCYPQLGVQCLDVGEDFVTAEYDLSEIERRPGGLISGPDQFRLADGALWFLTFAAIGRLDEMTVTSELASRHETGGASWVQFGFGATTKLRKLFLPLRERIPCLVSND